MDKMKGLFTRFKARNHRENPQGSQAGDVPVISSGNVPPSAKGEEQNGAMQRKFSRECRNLSCQLYPTSVEGETIVEHEEPRSYSWRPMIEESSGAKWDTRKDDITDNDTEGGVEEEQYRDGENLGIGGSTSSQSRGSDGLIDDRICLQTRVGLGEEDTRGSLCSAHEDETGGRERYSPDSSLTEHVFRKVSPIESNLDGNSHGNKQGGSGENLGMNDVDASETSSELTSESAESAESFSDDEYKEKAKGSVTNLVASRRPSMTHEEERGLSMWQEELEESIEDKHDSVDCKEYYPCSEKILGSFEPIFSTNPERNFEPTEEEYVPVDAGPDSTIRQDATGDSSDSESGEESPVDNDRYLSTRQALQEEDKIGVGEIAAPVDLEKFHIRQIIPPQRAQLYKFLN